MYKQYVEERELYKHLKWENQKLKEEYMKKN